MNNVEGWLEYGGFSKLTALHFGTVVLALPALFACAGQPADYPELPVPSMYESNLELTVRSAH